MKKLRILVTFGTRPEAIKLAPVIHELEEQELFEPIVCVTAQHREMLDQVLRFFEIRPDYDLDLMRPDQSLYEITANSIRGLEGVLEETKPSWVLVQGDTTTTLMAALAAFYKKVPVAHVEAGLRTADKYAPFPEEINRRLTSHIADLHFAPTERARRNLLSEGVPESAIVVTGNTVIDALLWTVERVRSLPACVDPTVFELLKNCDRRLLLVTAHRREAFGEGLREICLALQDLARRQEIVIIWPVHLNPHACRPVMELLAPVAHDLTDSRRLQGEIKKNLILLDPADYPTLVWLLDRSHLVLTDSGGIQEEAPTLGKPVLVLRDVTERPEGVEAGTARLVGPHRAKIVETVEQLLSDVEQYKRMSRASNPYGDGRARHRIVEALLARSSETSHS